MDSPTSALKPGRSGPGCEGKMCLYTPLVLGQCGTQGSIYLIALKAIPTGRTKDDPYQGQSGGAPGNRDDFAGYSHHDKVSLPSRTHVPEFNGTLAAARR